MKNISKIIISRIVFLTNHLYFKYCKYKFKKTVTSGNLITKGVQTYTNVFSAKEIENIVKDVKYKYSQSGNCISYKYGEYKDGYHSDFEAIYLKPQTLDPENYIHPLINNKILETIEAQIGSHYYLRQIAIMKTLANNHSKHGSFAFHRDSHPTLSFKLLVYLTDVTEESFGPTAYLEGTNQGAQFPFEVLGSEEREWNDEIYSKNCVLGKKGTGLLFNVNGLHAGGRTTKGERIILVYNFQPIHKKINIEKSLSYSKKKIGSWEFDILPGLTQ